jgi:hypothetical protein
VVDFVIEAGGKTATKKICQSVRTINLDQENEMLDSPIQILTGYIDYVKFLFEMLIYFIEQ